MAWPFKKPRAIPVEVRRSYEPLEWTIADGVALRDFLSSPPGRKMTMIAEDRVFNMVVANADRQAVAGAKDMLNFVYGLQAAEDRPAADPQELRLLQAEQATQFPDSGR